MAALLGGVSTGFLRGHPCSETTLRNANGGTVTCKQVGRGVVSYGVGKHLYDECVAKAHADGYQ
jgi:hypothetical protein